jgi:hypothetical protein
MVQLGELLVGGGVGFAAGHFLMGGNAAMAGGALGVAAVGLATSHIKDTPTKWMLGGLVLSAAAPLIAGDRGGLTAAVCGAIVGIPVGLGLIAAIVKRDAKLHA